MELKTDLEIIEHKKMDSCYGTLVYFITHTVPMFFHWFGSDKEWHKKQTRQTFADDIEVTCLEEERHHP